MNKIWESANNKRKRIFFIISEDGFTKHCFHTYSDLQDFLRKNRELERTWTIVFTYESLKDSELLAENTIANIAYISERINRIIKFSQLLFLDDWELTEKDYS